MNNINRSWKKVIDIIASNLDIFPNRDFRIVFKLLKADSDRDSIMENFPNAVPLMELMRDIDYTIENAGDDLPEVLEIIASINARLFPEETKGENSK